MIATNVTTLRKTRGGFGFLDGKVVVGLMGSDAMEMKWKTVFGRGKRGG